MDKDLYIMIVDDDKDDIFLFTESLAELGFTRIRSFLSSVEALEHLHRTDEYPDVIVTDHKMPLVTGIELIEKMRSTPQLAAVPVVLFSTSTYDVEIEQARIAGALGYLIKPFHFTGYEVASSAIKLKILHPEVEQPTDDPAIRWF